MARHSKSDLWEVLQQGHEGDLRFQASRGKLTMEGKRLDAPSSPLRAWIPDGYGDKGFQATELISSQPWDVGRLPVRWPMPV